MDQLSAPKRMMASGVLELLNEAMKRADQAALLLTAARISSAIDALEIESRQDSLIADKQ